MANTNSEVSKRRLYFSLSLMGSLVTALAILTYQNYFLFVPFANGISVLSFLASLTILGWVSLLIAPPLILARGMDKGQTNAVSSKSEWTGRETLNLIVLGTLWTSTTLAIKVYGLVVSGSLWAGYLLTYPILIFVEWLLPGFYVFVALNLMSEAKKKKSGAGAGLSNQVN